MARYPQGVSVTIGPLTVTDSTGTLVDATSATVTVHKPDGTATTGSPYTATHDSTGTYHIDLPDDDIATIGHYPWVFAATVSGKTGKQVGSFEVTDPFEVSVLSLQDGRAALNIDDSSEDERILRKIATIESNIEMTIGGPIITRAITDERVRVGDGYRTLTVRYRPLVSVTSITDVASGVALSLTDLDLDLTAGVIRRKLQLPFWSWGPFYLVTYTAGLGTSVPPAITEFAEVVLAHLWELERGATMAPSFGGEETTTLPGWGYAIPLHAAQLIAPYAAGAYV